jgi:hypothetical protein
MILFWLKSILLLLQTFIVSSTVLVSIRFYDSSSCSSVLSSSVVTSSVCESITLCSSTNACYADSYILSCTGADLQEAVSTSCSTSASSIKGSSISGSTSSCHSFSNSTIYHFSLECKEIQLILYSIFKL